MDTSMNTAKTCTHQISIISSVNILWWHKAEKSIEFYVILVIKSRSYMGALHIGSSNM